MKTRKTSSKGTQPPWIISYSDLMTLLMTFFVMLVAMSVVDERSSVELIRSVSTVFGPEGKRFNPFEDPSELRDVVPGPFGSRDAALQELRQVVFDSNDDVRLKQNSQVIIVSFKASLLFDPGSSTLRPGGTAMLGRVLPLLQNMQYPMSVGGHASTRLDEQSTSISPQLNGDTLDPSWEISYDRTLAVYQFFKEHGVPPSRMSMESFGQYHPEYSNNTPDGREKNRRVELVLDKRNSAIARSTKELEVKKAPAKNDFYFKEFHFNLDDDAPENGAPGMLPPSQAGGAL